MTGGAGIVRAARGWIGTPYVHQASVRGAGCDCLGLLRGVWRDCLGPEPETVPPYTMDWSEPQGDEALMRLGLRCFFLFAITINESSRVAKPICPY